METSAGVCSNRLKTGPEEAVRYRPIVMHKGTIGFRLDGIGWLGEGKGPPLQPGERHEGGTLRAGRHSLSHGLYFLAAGASRGKVGVLQAWAE